MATNLFAGRKASLLVAAASSASASNIGSVRNFKLEVKRSEIDVTNFDSSGWRQLLDGVGDWQFTCEALLLSTNASNYAQQFRMRTALSSGARQYFQVKNSTASGAQAGQTWKGFGYVTGWTWNGDIKDAQLHNFTVMGDGKLTEA